MKAPARYWWLVLVLVPLAIAVIEFGPDWLQRSRDRASPGVSYVNYGGGQTHVQGDLAFNALSVILEDARGVTDGEIPEEFMQTVRAAMQHVEAGEVERAIPLLQSAAETVPLPALQNNLAAAYLAVGERERAGAVLAEAEPSSLAARSAIAHNRRQLEATAAPVLSPWAPTDAEGVLAALTRCDDTGGMLTVEVIYRNTGDAVWIRARPEHGYLLDEETGERWTPTVASGHHDHLDKGAQSISWMKFTLDGEPPERLTVVAHRAQRPFENVRCRLARD